MLYFVLNYAEIDLIEIQNEFVCDKFIAIICLILEIKINFCLFRKGGEYSLFLKKNDIIYVRLYIWKR